MSMSASHRNAAAQGAFPASSTVAQAFEAFIAEQAFPCLGAKAASARDSISLIEAGDLRDDQFDAAIVAGVQAFAARAQVDTLFTSLVVLFAPAPGLSEQAFEQAMWQRLQAWHVIDHQQFSWDPQVSNDPASSTFSFSLGGSAFYLIGLHPAASRPARRFQQPAVVLNLHSQFEQLRADGRYEKLRAAITARDIALAGSRNPMLAEHGKAPEARQYSGRAVDAHWVCPFHAQGGSR